mmetsp:Transcript_5046/g.11240  ORF Transcript_5046/g.11240 Transcript_5046/m.11240 type:complete len:143 (-) Transcript_5046:323-751(-)|eukprot:CAMPEP_0168183596 /NCGR_PEP_ID=MMETSP0139_2-20121125/12671_1 /TAXON_ID=44445 /ORGANISM="Pseudo-nitzschia australis, Strain 10249 10 AB" /LENGTH=142 /DNA_ID=CAMNT_0008104923 /DNA_START=202 /DNA_END=630 /DNA_ORIENTATION=+
MSDATETRPASPTAGNAAAAIATTTGTSGPSSTAAGASARGIPPVGSATATMTITAEEPQEVLRLTLVDRPNVHWDETVINNEGMGRKSSKRCCIFHKQKPFGESSTDSSDYDDDDDDDNKKIAHKKDIGKKKTPDHLRFHA